MGPPLSTTAELPILAHRDAIAAALRDHQVVVVCGETGSGKSTQLPRICLDLGRGRSGRIGLTQPRRIAARSIAQRLADLLGTSIGETVGYSVRFSDRTGPATRVKVMTDGILLAETQHDRSLGAYDTIIVDEAHERSLNIDFLLGYLKRLLGRRGDLRVIVSSATIDPHRFSEHFGGAPVVEVAGRVHPVELRYRPPEGGERDEDDPALLGAIVDAVGEVLAEGPGDILVFLSGEREILQSARALRGRHGERLEILPLYARLSEAEQQRIFQPHPGRRVILSTNVAETSLTVPGIRFVVDPGLARMSRYSARSRIQRLPIEPISQASARQRAGRCGRLGPGVCIRLYSEEDFESREPYTPAEILRSNLAGVILTMKALDLGEIAEFPFLDQPPRGMVRDGLETLTELGALDTAGRLTAVGRRLSRLPVDPRLGRMILAAADTECLRDVLTIAAGLSVQDPRERPAAQTPAADEAHRAFFHPRSDFLTLLAIWDGYHEARSRASWSGVRAWCRQRFISFARMREWMDVRRQIEELMRREKRNQVPFSSRGPESPCDSSPKKEPGSFSPEHAAIHRALLAGLLGQVGFRGRRERRERGSFRGPRESTFFIHPGSALFEKPPEWVMAAEIVDTTRRYARGVARIEPAWIEQAAGHLLTRTHADPWWDAQSGCVRASERATLWGLEIFDRRRVDYGPIDSPAARAIFVREALVAGHLRTRAAFADHNRRLVEEITLVEAKRRRHDLLADEARRIDFYDRRLPAGITGADSFDRWRRQAEREDPSILFMTGADVLREGADTSPGAAPDALAVGDVTLPLSYRFEPGSEDDGVTVTVPLALLEQVTGLRLAWSVPIQLHERLTEMLRGLPKELRRHFVPAPDWAAAIAGRLRFGEGDLHQALSAMLEELSGVRVSPNEWAEADALLPPHLVMRIAVVDAQGRQVAAGRDLEKLRAELGATARAEFRALGGERYERAGIVRWDFGDLPESLELRRGVRGWPALVDRGTSAALQLFPTCDAATAAHRGGVRRLFLLELGPELTELLDWMPGLSKLELLHAPLGSGAELRAALAAQTAERAFLAIDAPPRSAEAFAARLESGRSDLWKHAEAAFGLAARVLEARQSGAAALEKLAGRSAFADALADARAHFARLLPRGVLADTPPARLEHLPRYLEALRRRLDRLPTALDKDRQRRSVVDPLEASLAARAAELEGRGVHDAELKRFRWMLEELRVSLWAQELGTAEPVSEKRLAEQWARVQA